MNGIAEFSFAQTISVIGYVVESVGVVIIVFGSIWAIVRAVRTYLNHVEQDHYHRFRRDLARVMMLGLEFLVAGDIIRTVIVGHTISDVAALGLVVLIRTILVFTIHLELEGRWPWQSPASDVADRTDPR